MIFSPSPSQTRQDLLTILYRYTKQIGKEVSNEYDISYYEDYEDVADYAQDGLKWAIGSGFLSGLEKYFLTYETY